MFDGLLHFVRVIGGMNLVLVLVRIVDVSLDEAAIQVQMHNVARVANHHLEIVVEAKIVSQHRAQPVGVALEVADKGLPYGGWLLLQMFDKLLHGFLGHFLLVLGKAPKQSRVGGQQYIFHQLDVQFPAPPKRQGRVGVQKGHQVFVLPSRKEAEMDRFGRLQGGVLETVLFLQLQGEIIGFPHDVSHD